MTENLAGWQGEPFLTQKPAIELPRVFDPLDAQENEKVLKVFYLVGPNR